MDISGTQLRAVRAALFTALVVTLSAASHVLLSRAPLPPATVAAIAAAVFAIAYATAGRERGYGRIAALLIPLELAADTVFTAGQHVCYGEAGGPVAGPLRAVGFDVLCGGAPVGTPLARMTGRGARHRLAARRRGPGRRLAAARRAHRCGPPRGGLAAARRAGAGPAAARGRPRPTFRPLLLVVASVTAPRPPVQRLPRPERRARIARTRLLVHFVGRRGPPCSAAFA